MNSYPANWPRGKVLGNPKYPARREYTISGIVGVDNDGFVYYDSANPNLTPLFRGWVVSMSRSGRTGLNKAILTDGESAWGMEMQTPSKIWASCLSKEAATTMTTARVKHPLFRLSSLLDCGQIKLRLDKDRINTCIGEFLNEA